MKLSVIKKKVNITLKFVYCEFKAKQNSLQTLIDSKEKVIIKILKNYYFHEGLILEIIIANLFFYKNKKCHILLTE